MSSAATDSHSSPVGPLAGKHELQQKVTKYSDPQMQKLPTLPRAKLGDGEEEGTRGSELRETIDLAHCQFVIALSVTAGLLTTMAKVLIVIQLRN